MTDTKSVYGRMLVYLKKKLDNDEIESEYDQNFIRSMQTKLSKGFNLTYAQEEYLYQLYHHKY